MNHLIIYTYILVDFIYKYTYTSICSILYYLYIRTGSKRRWQPLNQQPTPLTEESIAVLLISDQVIFKPNGRGGFQISWKTPVRNNTSSPTPLVKILLHIRCFEMGEAGLRLHESFGCVGWNSRQKKKNIPLTSVHSIAGIDQTAKTQKSFSNIAFSGPFVTHLWELISDKDPVPCLFCTTTRSEWRTDSLQIKAGLKEEKHGKAL